MTRHQQAIVLSGPELDDPGPLTRTVVAYDQTIAGLVPTVQSPDDWAPVAAFVDVDTFERVGTFCEVQDWQQYLDLLTRWATATDRFETEVRRITELSHLVYYEIIERHARGGEVHEVNTLTVFEFNGAGKVCHLDVYLQQAR